MRNFTPVVVGSQVDTRHLEERAGHEVEVTGRGRAFGHALTPVAGPVVVEDVVRPAEERLIAQAFDVSRARIAVAGECEELAVVDREFVSLQDTNKR